MMKLLCKKKYIILLLMGFLPAIWSCSYRFSGSGSLPSGISRIYVSVIENRTSEAGIEKYITDGLITEFIQRRKDLLSRQEEAEGILSGSIVSIQDTSIAHSSQSKTTQSRVVLVLSLKLANQEGKTIWAVNGINANQAYNVSNDQTLTEQNKKRAIQILSKRLAEKVYNRLTDDF
jgi:hypothetical protein